MIEKISRTQKKKAAQALQKIGEQLVQLGEAQVAAMNLPEDLAAAVQMARQMTRHEARRRQMQYIGSLMRQLDVEQIQKEIAGFARRDHDAVRRFKLAEQLRDGLVAGDDIRLDWLKQQLSKSDQDQLLQLVRNARDASARRNLPNAGRQLFRFLRQCIEKLNIS